MGIETYTGDVYRLILALDTRVVVAVDNHYQQFEDAQARVADTVCRYARNGRVRAIALQRGRHNGRSSSHRRMLPNTTPETTGYTWTIEKQWGPEVILRILTQNKIELPATETPRLNGNSIKKRTNGVSRTPKPISTETTTTAPRSPISPSRHKSMRWQVFASIAAVIFAMIALILFQTGGHPDRLFSAIMGCGTSVKNELPFDARTSFDTPPRQQPPNETRSDQ